MYMYCVIHELNKFKIKHVLLDKKALANKKAIGGFAFWMTPLFNLLRMNFRRPQKKFGNKSSSLIC